MAYTRTFENVQPFFGSPYSKQSVSHIESKGMTIAPGKRVAFKAQINEGTVRNCLINQLGKSLLPSLSVFDILSLKSPPKTNPWYV